jgi:putative ABC transport system permease protein
MKPSPSRRSRLMRALLRLLPFEFRFDYGREMEEVFRLQRRDAVREGGRPAVVGLWLAFVRDVLRWAPREHAADVARDVRYAIRGLRRNPGFACVAVLTLALGIGVNTAIFSVVDQVLLRPTDVTAFDRVVMVWETDRKTGTIREPASVPDYLDFSSRSRSLAPLAAFIPADVNLSVPGGEPLRLAGLAVSHNFLPMMGARPVAGRLFTPEEDRRGGPRVVLIGEGLWARAFGRAPGIVGRTLSIDDVPHEIVGVIPSGSDFGVLQVLGAAAYGRSFADRGTAVTVDVWRPLQADVEVLPRETHPVFQVARLTTDLGTAQQEIGGVALDLEKAFPTSNANRGAFVEPLRDVVFGPVRPALYTLLAGVALVLLTACVNLANLLLARGASRVSEVSLRAALGASRFRVARQFLIESLVLALLAGLAGAAGAMSGLRLLLSIAPPDLPRLSAVAIDLRVLAATLAVTVVAGVVTGMVPTWQARRLDVQGALGGERNTTPGPDRRRAGGTLIVVEVALTVVLLVAGGLVARSFWHLRSVDPGFRTGGLIKAEYQLPASRYPADFKNWPEFREMHAFTDAVLRRASSLPGVDGVAVAAEHPLDPGFTNSFSVVGREAEAKSWPEVSVRRVTKDYFKTVGLALVRGRLFDDRDGTRSAPALLVNEAAARRFFDGRDPIGAQVRFWGASRTIVGIVADERFRGLAAPPAFAVYAPLAQAPSATGAGVLLVRTTGDPSALAAAVRGIIREQDPGLAVFGVEPLDATLSRSISRPRFTAVLLAVFAGVALLLAAVGIYGLLAYSVAQRRREIGIRLALGARPAQVSAAVVRRGLRLAVVGLAIGLPAAAGTVRLLQSLLFDTRPGDPLTYLAVAAVVALASAAAAVVPARRATRVDPALALRGD